jgi:hypothetical protein
MTIDIASGLKMLQFIQPTFQTNKMSLNGWMAFVKILSVNQGGARESPYRYSRSSLAR